MRNAPFVSLKIMLKTITITELHDQFQKHANGDLFLDVRTEKEFSEGHIPGARNIPVNVVPNHANELKTFKNIYVYCKMGGRAMVACEMLGALGIQNLHCVDDGGFPDWADAGFESAN